MRPDLFVHTLNTLQYGETAEELSTELDKCIEAATDTGKQAKLTVTLTIKPTTRDGFQYEINDSIKAQIPQKDRPITLLFRTDDKNLQRENPAQKTMDLKEAGNEKPEQFKQAGEL